MKKRIFNNMSLIALLTILLFVGLWALIFSGQFESQIKSSIKTLRLTIISQSGDVIFDNYAAELDNHADRPEVISAMEKGYGESERFSLTTGSKTYYYAIRLNNNSIIRLALTTESIYGWLIGLIPMVLFCFVVVLMISFILSRRLTNKIIEPINSIDLDKSNEFVYDELTPFTKKIELQKHQIQEQLSVLENRADTIKTITENMKEGLIFIDNNGVVLSSNKSIDEIFDVEEIVGKNILHLNRNMELMEKIKQSFTGVNSEMQLERNGKSYTVYINPARQSNSISGAIILFLDTTEKSKAEKHRKEFSANVSHELKTPLTTITALAEMISNGMAKPEDIKSFAQKITMQSKRLLYLIDDIIKLSEFDEGSHDKQFEPFDLYELSYTIVAGLRDRASQKNVTLELKGKKTQLIANKRMIDELLFNLIDNGIKYNKDGGKVTVSLICNNNQTTISISDTGIGIPSEHLNRIFERFYRVDRSRSKRTGGTGLGLSIVKHIVEYHGGKIEIDSKIGSGTTINCSFILN